MATKNPFDTKQFFHTVMIVLVLAGVCGIVFSVEKIFSLSKEVWRASSEQSMYVTGTSKVTVMPDVAYVSYQVKVSGKDSKKATSDLTTKIDKAISEFTKAGIPRAHIYLSQYQVMKIDAYNPDGEATVSNSDVSQNVTVQITGNKKELNDKLAVLEKVSGTVGLTPFSNGSSYICLDFSDKTSIFSGARKIAVDDAYRQAYDLASAGRLSVGRIINISDNMYGFGGNSPYSGYCNTQLGSGRVIEEQEVPVSVSVTFEVK